MTLLVTSPCPIPIYSNKEGTGEIVTCSLFLIEIFKRLRTYNNSVNTTLDTKSIHVTALRGPEGSRRLKVKVFP